MYMNWKPIKSTNDRYLCNKQGQIKGTDRIVSFGNQKRLAKGRIMLAKTKSNGYQEVSLSLEAQKNKSFYVHRLVAETWLGKIPEKMTINHKDGDKKNNKIDNLEIVTHSENVRHAYRTGLQKPRELAGSAHPRAKTNETEVLQIRTDHNNHHSIKRLVKDYPHLTRGSLVNIVYRSCWKHI